MKYLLLSMLALLMMGCSHTQIADYQGRTPTLDPKVFFDGKICADGVVRDYSGKQIRSFNAEIVATWDEQGVGTLDEVFEFQEEDGQIKTETRVWTLTPRDDGTYKAQANDVPTATTMRHAGNSIHMNYVLEYGEPGDTLDLTMDDWMFQVRDGVVINETRMSKWGLHVGQILLVMRQVDDTQSCLNPA
ncbi:DUF3833 family protein [Bermanella sp. R86510]|uniref:DUF3833 family protein n=1 Tax=unclassified Bermanella TaxID=2627862 RepID=UPI0037CACB99